MMTHELATGQGASRRWRQFSVRTLLVLVAIVAIWLGWIRWQVRQRQIMVDLILNRGGVVHPYIQTTALPTDPDWYREKIQKCPSFVRMWFGDQGWYYIRIRRGPDGKLGFSWDEREQIQRWFPEAFVLPEHRKSFVEDRDDDSEPEKR